MFQRYTGIIACPQTAYLQKQTAAFTSSIILQVYVYSAHSSLSPIFFSNAAYDAENNDVPDHI